MTALLCYYASEQKVWKYTVTTRFIHARNSKGSSFLNLPHSAGDFCCFCYFKYFVMQAASELLLSVVIHNLQTIHQNHCLFVSLLEFFIHLSREDIAVYSSNIKNLQNIIYIYITCKTLTILYIFQTSQKSNRFCILIVAEEYFLCSFTTWKAKWVHLVIPNKGNILCIYFMWKMITPEYVIKWFTTQL